MDAVKNRFFDKKYRDWYRKSLDRMGPDNKIIWPRLSSQRKREYAMLDAIDFLQDKQS